MYRNRNFQLVTISLDEPEKKDEAAIDVLRKNHVAATNYLLKTEDRDKFAEALDKEWPGPIPYTLLIEPGGKILHRKVGAIDPLEVQGDRQIPRPDVLRLVGRAAEEWASHLLRWCARGKHWHLSRDNKSKTSSPAYLVDCRAEDGRLVLPF